MLPQVLPSAQNPQAAEDRTTGASSAASSAHELLKGYICCCSIIALSKHKICSSLPGFSEAQSPVSTACVAASHIQKTEFWQMIKQEPPVLYSPCNCNYFFLWSVGQKRKGSHDH